MMTANECLDHATTMDACAARCHADYRAEYLAIAQGWRFAATMAHWQDEWAKNYEIAN